MTPHEFLVNARNAPKFKKTGASEAHSLRPDDRLTEAGMLADELIEDLYQKKCSKCKRTLTVFAFSGRKSAKDGLDSQCKECQSAAAAARYAADPEKYSRQSAAYRKANHDKCMEQINRWKSANPGRVKAHRDTYLANKKADKCAH